MYMEWDQGIYETLPIDRAAFRRIKERQIPEDVYSEIRSVFLDHSVQNDLGLCIVHRHFSLQPSEQLVEYHHVTAPWRVRESPDYLQPRISPKNWAFIEGKLFPYEFRFTDSDDTPEHYSIPSAFVSDLLDLFSRYDLRDVYGLVALKDEDRDIAKGASLEFTAGRTNVVVPFKPDMEKFRTVEASWLFPCAGSFLEPKDGGGGVTTRFCFTVCDNHDDDDWVSGPE